MASALSILGDLADGIFECILPQVAVRTLIFPLFILSLTAHFFDSRLRTGNISKCSHPRRLSSEPIQPICIHTYNHRRSKFSFRRYEICTCAELHRYTIVCHSWYEFDCTRSRCTLHWSKFCGEGGRAGENGFGGE